MEIAGLAAAGWMAVAAVTLLAASVAALSRSRATAGVAMASAGVVALEVLAHAEVVAVAQLSAILLGLAAARIGTNRLAGAGAAVLVGGIWLVGTALATALLRRLEWPESLAGQAAAVPVASAREVLVNAMAPFAAAGFASVLGMAGWAVIAPGSLPAMADGPEAAP